jgi:hypothetical protein
VGERGVELVDKGGCERGSKSVNDVLVIPFPRQDEFFFLGDVSAGEHAELEPGGLVGPSPEEGAEDNIGVTPASDVAKRVAIPARVYQQVDRWSDRADVGLGHAEAGVLIYRVAAVRGAVDDLSAVLADKSAGRYWLVRIDAVEGGAGVDAGGAELHVGEGEE